MPDQPIPPVPVDGGFLAPDVALPSPPPLDAAARERAARLVVAIQRHRTPEDVVLGVGRDVVDAAMRDPLERAEADDWAGLLARVLLAGAGGRS